MIPAPVGAGKNTKNVMEDENSSELKFFLGTHNSELFLSFTPNSELFREAA